MPTRAMRSTIDVRQFTLCENVLAFASSIASTSTVDIVAAGAFGGGEAAVEELPDETPLNDGDPVAGVAAPARVPSSLKPTFEALDRDAALIRSALARDPDSTLLLEQLRRTYAHRLALTQRLAYT